MNTVAKRFKKGIFLPRILVGLFIVSLVILTAVVSIFYTPADPVRMNVSQRLQPPTPAHLMGTDQYGRDILSRVMAGSVNTFMVGIIAVGIGIFFGLFFGSAAAMNGGWLDESIMRLMDLLYGFPPLLSAILITSIYGGGIVNSMIAIGIFNVPIFSRLCRGSILTIREKSYVEAARSLGQKESRVLFRHIFPNAMIPVIVQATVQFATAVLAEAALSYLGLGVQPPDASWGLMLKQAQTFMAISPWPAVFPGLSIVIFVFGLNFLGDGLRDLFDPKLARGY